MVMIARQWLAVTTNHTAHDSETILSPNGPLAAWPLTPEFGH